MLSIEQIAEKYNCSISSVRQRIHRSETKYDYRGSDRIMFFNTDKIEKLFAKDKTVYITPSGLAELLFIDIRVVKQAINDAGLQPSFSKSNGPSVGVYYIRDDIENALTSWRIDNDLNYKRMLFALRRTV